MYKSVIFQSRRINSTTRKKKGRKKKRKGKPASTSQRTHTHTRTSLYSVIGFGRGAKARTHVYRPNPPFSGDVFSVEFAASLVARRRRRRSTSPRIPGATTQNAVGSNLLYTRGRDLPLSSDDDAPDRFSFHNAKLIRYYIYFSFSVLCFTTTLQPFEMGRVSRTVYN